MRLGQKRYICTKRRKKKALFFVFSICLICVLIVLMCAFVSLRSSVAKMAKSKVKEIALITINEAISENMADDIYSDFARFTYSAEGNVTSIENNLTKISKKSADLALVIGKAIGGISKEKLSVPLGTLSGVDILYGMGPDIQIEIKPYGNAKAELKTNFYSSGINQTVFELTADVSVGISSLMPTIRTGEMITTSVPVASTVIVGDVPDSYTNVERHGFEYEDDVLELIE